MIINPIIPIWLMAIICVIFIILIVFNKHERKSKSRIINVIVKILIVVFLFIINLRIMLPNGEMLTISSDMNVLFVIDKSVSMRALDYNGNKERLEGVVNDCCYIVDELAGCKFSIITFGDTAEKITPFTTDADMIQAELKAISLENDFYAEGTSINLVNDTLEKTLKKESEKHEKNSKFVLFFISDGEITKENERLESFSNIQKYISDGAVMGYGTTSGGKMISSLYEDSPESKFYYLYYYDDNYNMVTAVSKLDEKNLKQIASDIGIDYVQMNKKSNINRKLSSVKQQVAESLSNEEKVESYNDIYYWFAIPLAILLIIDLALKKKKLM